MFATPPARIFPEDRWGKADPSLLRTTGDGADEDSVNTGLEIQYSVHLHHSRAPRTQEPTEEVVIAAGSQTGKVRMIQGIEHIRAKLHPSSFADRNTEILCETEIEIPHARLPD